MGTRKQRQLVFTAAQAESVLAAYRSSRREATGREPVIRSAGEPANTARPVANQAVSAKK